MSLSLFAQRRSERFPTAQGVPDTILKRLQESDGVHRSHIDTNKLPQGAKLWSVAQSPDKRLWIVTDRGAFVAQGDEYRPLSKPTAYLTRQEFVNVDAVFTCAAVDSIGHVWLGTNFGIYATDGKNYWNPVDARAGLPYETVTCMALAPDGGIWVGTTQGVCHYTTKGEWEYYWGKRWLPHNRVKQIVAENDGSAWVATESGYAHLYHKPTTLAQKAEHYEAITARHNRYGFVTGSSLRVPGDPTKGVIFEASDNDGLWTGLYVGAEAFRYATTKDPKAKALAKKSLRAMLDLVKYTGIPGFPARAIFRKGEEITGYNPEETVRPEGETEKIWFTSPVDKDVICKGDTSSDEMDGHYFAWYLYYKHVADEAEKQEIATVVRTCTENILQHDLTLVGHTGRKTRWGVWNPKFINDDPIWWEERGLNSLEILSFLKVAEFICKEPKYGEKYRELITKHHYLLNTVHQKVNQEWFLVNHSDDEMTFMVYYLLMDIEKDPAILRLLRQSLERSWKIERPEASPFFNFVYGAMTGSPCDIEASIVTLQDWAWELVDWEVRGTHRNDVTVLRTERGGRAAAQTTVALSPAERRLMRWNGNPYECDGGDPQGRSEEDAAVWLLPYWMGRYHGFIRSR
jgi:hypothetical protein